VLVAILVAGFKFHEQHWGLFSNPNGRGRGGHPLRATLYRSIQHLWAIPIAT